MKIACFSVAAMDYFPKLNQYFPGGNALNQAINLVKLGYDTAFFGAVGSDASGDRIIKLLKESGVDCSHCIQVDGETASNQLVNDANGERFGIEGAWKNGVFGTYQFQKADWDALQSYDVWSTNSFDPHFETTLELQKQYNAVASHRKLCVDFMHLPDPSIMELSLQVVDIAYAGGTPDMQSAFEVFAKSHPTTPIVLTLGAEGSIAYYQNQVFRQPALPIKKVVDTTGCGDAFQAAFTGAFLKYGNIEQALLAGAQRGQKTAQHVGAQSG